MDEAQDSFISSCMWTERIGFVQLWQQLKNLSDYLQKIDRSWSKN